jgi:hypothetical protein
MHLQPLLSPPDLTGTDNRLPVVKLANNPAFQICAGQYAIITIKRNNRHSTVNTVISNIKIYMGVCGGAAG